MKKQVPDTPSAGAWCTKVNQPGFVVKPSRPQRVVIGKMTHKEYCIHKNLTVPH